ncbi:MAG TPA: RnfABCDGE type electron transport complex subunit D [Gemmataceae bacterium]|nr:RnfABCDGE type electron transport complex subunit D [Gemmataceae bacterium]
MNTNDKPGLNGAASPPPGKMPPPEPAGDKAVAVAVRLLISAVVVICYFVSYSAFTKLFLDAARRIGFVPDLAVPRVVAVTLLGAILVAIWWKLIKRDVRFHAPILITYILLVADATYGILDNHTSEWLTWLTNGKVTSYSPTFVAMMATVAIDMVMARFMRGKWPHISSAYITGISVGILIKSPELWPFIMCGLISIMSKYALRFRGRHLWNPSNFGVTMLLTLAGERLASLSVQAGNEIWPVLLIWALGSLILYRLGRLHIPLVFLATFIPLGFVRAAVTGNGWQAELGPVTWPMFQLYIFFMITDPPTTTKKRWSQCLVAALVAVMDTIIRLTFREVHALYYALFIVGPISNFIEILLTSKAKKPTGLIVPTTANPPTEISPLPAQKATA